MASATETKSKTLIIGAGAPSDILLASLLYRCSIRQSTLGCIRHVPISAFRNSAAQHGANVAIINSNTRIHNANCYMEPLIAREYNTNIVAMSTRNNNNDISIASFRDSYNSYKNSTPGKTFITSGDSSLLCLDPIKDNSRYTLKRNDIFNALVKETQQAINNLDAIAVLFAPNMNREEFNKNIDIMRSLNMYYGSYNMINGPSSDFRFNNMFNFNQCNVTPWYEMIQSRLIFDYAQNEQYLSWKKDMLKGNCNILPLRIPSYSVSTFYNAAHGNISYACTYDMKVPVQTAVDINDATIHFIDAKGLYDIIQILQSGISKEQLQILCRNNLNNINNLYTMNLSHN